MPEGGIRVTLGHTGSVQATNRALVHEASVSPPPGAQEPLHRTNDTLQDKVVGPLQAKIALSPFQPRNPESIINNKPGSLDLQEAKQHDRKGCWPASRAPHPF